MDSADFEHPNKDLGLILHQILKGKLQADQISVVNHKVWNTPLVFIASFHILVQSELIPGFFSHST